MALFRKFFYKKPPDGLLEITERVYVFDYCFTTEVMDESEYKGYIGGIIRQIGEHFPDASFMVFNMREGEHQSHISNILCDYDMTVMDYPRQYEGCPLLTMEMIHHFLRSGENWLQLGQQNIVLMHCERGGWPVLAFMLASLLIYRKMFTGEQKTLDMIYKQAPRELLQLMSPLNPLPSQLRYLQYISRRNVGSEWPPLDRALTLDCVIIRQIPNMDGDGGCRPIFRIYGQDPFIPADRTPKVLFSTPKKSKLVRYFKQADCELVKIDIHCHVQGDVVLECISLESDLEREQMMFRVMFNTAFIRSNILMLNRDEIDMLWNAKDHFPKNFRVEVLFSDMDTSSSSDISLDLPPPRTEEKEGLPVEAFDKVKEIFSNVDWLDPKTDVANMLQQITSSNILLERLDSGASSGSPNTVLNESFSGRLKFDSKTQKETSNLKSSDHEELPDSPLQSSEDATKEKMLEPKLASKEKIKTPASLGQAVKPIPSFDPSKDSDSTKIETKSSESKQSSEKKGSLESEKKNIVSLASKEAVLKKDTVFPASESSTVATPVKNIRLSGSKEKEVESLDSEVRLKNDSRPKFDPKTQPEVEITSLKSAGQEKFSVPSLESFGDATLGKKKEPLDLIDQGKQHIHSVGLPSDSNLTEKKIESLKSKAPVDNLTKLPMSTAQGKQYIPSAAPSSEANSLEQTVEKSKSKKKDTESLESNDTKFPMSTAQGKQSTSLIAPSTEKDSTEQTVEKLKSKKKDTESLESKSLLENDTKFPISMAQGKQQSIPSIKPSVEADSTKQTTEKLKSKKKDTESLESKSLLENDTKFPTSMAQGKQQSIPSIKPSVEADSTEQTMEKLKAKKKDTTSLESKSLLENDTKLPTSMAQGKQQSIPSIEPSAEADSTKQTMEKLKSNKKDTESLESKSFLQNDTKREQSVPPVIQTSMDSSSKKTMIEKSESPALSKNDIKSHVSMVDKKQTSPFVEPGVDAKSIKKKIDPQELQVSLQLPTQSKIISPRMHQAIRPASASASYASNPLLGSPVAISRYHSAPSALGITSVLQDHTLMDSKEEPTHAVSISAPSDSKVPKSAEPCSTSIPTTSSSSALLPSLPLKSSVDPPASVEKTIKPLVPIPPPPPPPPPPHQELTSNLTQSTIPVTQYSENSMHDKNRISLAPPPSPPSSSLIETSLSTVKDSSKGPPPPPPPPLPSSTVQTSSSSIPPPPVPPPQNTNNSISMPGPPPPPPPPSQSGSAPLAPPPPPPPISASQNSKSAPNVPPPPPSANGLSKPGTASSQSPAVPRPPGNAPPAPGPPGNVPPIPGPPSGAFGAKGRGMLRANAKTQTKRSNLKPYHWLKLTRAMHGSLWAETQKLDEACRAPEFDMTELESLFSAATPNTNNEKGGKSNRRSAQKPDKVQIIELRRAYNCEIMLTKVKIPLPDLMSNVLALDDSVLYVDQVENLIKFCPTKEEMDQLKAYTGDTENLGKCEKFFLELMKVPRVESKLRVFCFKMQFCSQVSDLKRDLNIVNSASEQIRNSVKLKRIMQTILSLGNALNHGTARGAAVGFRLDSLLKLTDTRARNNKMTLMHYLCKVLAEKLPELLDFHKDLVSLEASTKLQLKYLAEEMQAISKGLEKVIQELSASENDGPVSECFCQILKEFLSHAEAEVRSLAQLYANVGRNADALALYFGEDPARCPFEQVVSTLLNFVRMFIRAHDENCKQIEYEKKKADKEAAENEKLKVAARNESKPMMRTTIKSGDVK
ncbi:formin-like protein 18 [Vicia villosa]|uniref:formin-like protein 18 n=1 Tax=Vicia villosa TaxID=3911 RepID=UPI00273B79B3|nr:formin-like protein 18 [Vicia villosa]